MGATVAAVMGLLSAGDVLVTHTDTYGGTTEFFNVDAKRFGIIVHFTDVLDVKVLDATLSGMKAAEANDEGINLKKAKVMVFLETITNPVIREADVPAISAVVKKFGALLVVDHTFGTPIRERPLLQVCSKASFFLFVPNGGVN